MSLDVEWHAQAIDAAAMLPIEVKRMVRDSLEMIARHPEHPPQHLDWKPIRGTGTGYRLAIGDYRVICHKTDTKLRVLDIGPGHELYRRYR